MSKHRTSLLASFFSSMAVLSFKKKGKDETLEGAPSSLGDLSLNGGNLSLNDLGGGLGTLSKLSDVGQPTSSLGGNLIPEAPKGERKLQEMEASVNDLKSHLETSDLTTKSIKGELETMKGDLSQINDSIRTLLNVYEAVSKQYNPFVDGTPSPPAAPVRTAARPETAPAVDQVKAEQLEAKNEPPAAKAEMIADEPEMTAPFDAEGPLDHIVKPDADEMLSLNKEMPTMNDMTPVLNSSFNDAGPVAVKAPARRAASMEDVYALDQIRKLVDHLMGKMCTERAIGNEIDAADIKALELWLGEFKRLGGI